MRNVLLLTFGLTGLSTTGCSNTCEPADGRAYCEGDIVKACVEEDGKGVMQETDCAASGEVCASNAHLNNAVAAACRPAECEEGWSCFADNEGERMCDLSAANVYTCEDEGGGCFGWERVEECAALGDGLTCVEFEASNDASCE